MLTWHLLNDRLSALHILFHLILTTILEVDIITIPDFQRKNLWHIEAEKHSRVTQKVAKERIPAYVEPNMDLKAKLITSPR